MTDRLIVVSTLKLGVLLLFAAVSLQGELPSSRKLFAQTPRPEISFLDPSSPTVY